MTRLCSTLKPNEEVVFWVWSDIYKRKIPMNGTVISTYSERQTVDVSWMEGYKEYTKFLPYSDMIAVYDPDGEHMHFENIHGKSALLKTG